MITLNDRLDALIAWGQKIQLQDNELQEIIEKAYYENRWFTVENITFALSNIKKEFLSKEKLETWINNYQIPGENANPKTIGLILAGNIPLVGFHDLLSVLITGNRAQVKLSSKDVTLLPYLVKLLKSVSPELASMVEFAEKLHGFDAVIATGNNNSARYFNYYFGKYPHIIRKNRNSIAILTGNETESELQQLGHDIFMYFGLGCRNVSQVLFPKEYDVSQLLDNLQSFEKVMDHDKYKNNYDYNRTLLLMNTVTHYASDFLMLVENESPSSAIAALHYKLYSDWNDVKQHLDKYQNQIQCIMSNGVLEGEKVLPFGTSQVPELSDYADDVDIIEFLLKLEK